MANRVEAALPEVSSIYMNIEELIRILLPRNADYLIGYANLKGLLPEKYRGLDYAVVLGRRLDDRIIDAIIDGPNIEYYNHYTEVNLELAKVAHSLADAIRLQGGNSLVIEPTIHDQDLDKNFFNTLRFDFSHKMAATRAGLGWRAAPSTHWRKPAIRLKAPTAQNRASSPWLATRSVRRSTACWA